MKEKYLKGVLAVSTLLIAPSVPAQTPPAAATPEQMAKGKSAYALCAACHGVDGKGLPTTPPMAPSFLSSRLANAAPEVPITIVLKGIQKADAKFLGAMAPLGTTMNDEQIADVLTFVRNSWGNKSSAITATEVKEVREKYKTINAPLPRSGYDKKAEKLEAEKSAPK